MTIIDLLPAWAGVFALLAVFSIDNMGRFIPSVAIAATLLGLYAFDKRKSHKEQVEDKKERAEQKELGK